MAYKAWKKPQRLMNGSALDLVRVIAVSRLARVWLFEAFVILKTSHEAPGMSVSRLEKSSTILECIGKSVSMLDKHLAKGCYVCDKRAQNPRLNEKSAGHSQAPARVLKAA